MQGSKERLAKAEQALEALLDARLGAPSAAGQGNSDNEPGSDDSWPCGWQDDYVDSDAEAADSSGDSSGVADSRGASNRKPTNSSLQSKGRAELGRGRAQQEAHRSRAVACASTGGQWEEIVDDSNPDSFSQVDLSKPPAEIQTQFPLFPVRLQQALIVGVIDVSLYSRGSQAVHVLSHQRPKESALSDARF